MANLQDVALKVLTDKEFAQKLLSQPEATLRSAGIEPTAEMFDVLNGLNIEAIQALADDFRQGKAAT